MFRELLENEKVREFLRFCIVGSIAALIHYGVYLGLLTLTGTDSDLLTNIVYTVGYLAGWCCNLWLTAHFTFKTHISTGRTLSFALCHLINYGLHILLLNIFLKLGVAEQIAPIPVLCIVVPINFVLVRTVFKKLR